MHRALGYGLAGAAGAAGLGGLAFIALRGTVGGAPMDAGFGLYGALLVLAAIMAVRLSRAEEYRRHERWALRLAVLAMGSWLYRVQYGLWYLATGGAASRPDFSGAFDLAMNWAFFLPWLVVLELWLRRPRRAIDPAPAAP